MTERQLPQMWDLDDDDNDNDEKKSESGGMASKLLKARTIIISEPVSDKLYKSVTTMLTLLEQLDDSAPIDVFVNSPGGSADSGFAIYDLFRFSKCPIRTIANGIVASSAVLIYLGGDDEHHYALKNSRFLLHQPSTAARGQASDIDITAKEIHKIRVRYNEIVEEHTGKPRADIDRDAERDFWLNSDEAKEYGLVKKVLKSRSELD